MLDTLFGTDLMGGVWGMAVVKRRINLDHETASLDFKSLFILSIFT